MWWLDSEWPNFTSWYGFVAMNLGGTLKVWVIAYDQGLWRLGFLFKEH